jgi:hypothetical protein
MTGKHLRHARDHFTLLLDCISSPPPHILSYDTRSRNTPVESSLTAAREALLETIRRLEKVVPEAKLNEPVTLNAVTPHTQVFETSFGREVSEGNRFRKGVLIHFESCGLQVCIVFIIGRWCFPPNHWLGSY